MFKVWSGSPTKHFMKTLGLEYLESDLEGDSSIVKGQAIKQTKKPLTDPDCLGSTGCCLSKYPQLPQLN